MIFFVVFWGRTFWVSCSRFFWGGLHSVAGDLVEFFFEVVSPLAVVGFGPLLEGTPPKGKE